MSGTSRPGEAKGQAHDDGFDKLFSIGDLASELDVTTRAIRFYETKGLLSPRRVGGSRAYTIRDRARLLLILRGKRLGFSLDDIADYLDLYDADPNQSQQIQHLLGKVEGSIAGLEQKLTDLQSTLKELKDIRGKCKTALKAQKR
ncbi:MAG: MerR family DNA-binding transcriptional regulator [Hyphomicrobiaceae bacterium]